MSNRATILSRYTSKWTGSAIGRIRLNMNHLELCYYLYSAEVCAASDLYDRYITSKQTVRSRLALLQQCGLIKKNQRINFGGHNHSHFYSCTKKGAKLIKAWPFQRSIPSVSKAIDAIPVSDRESCINLAQLATLLSISDLRKRHGTAYVGDVINTFSGESISTVQRRITYLKTKSLIALEKVDQRRNGISSTLRLTLLGSRIVKKFSLKPQLLADSVT